MAKKKSPWFKVRVVKCNDPDLWAYDKVGKVIIVKRTDWDEGYFEHKSGYSVSKHDVEMVAKGAEVWL